MNTLRNYFESIILAILRNILFIFAGILALFWYHNERNFEPLITVILIIAGILSISIERWFNLKEKRRELLHELVHELYINLNIVNDSKFNPNSNEAEKFVVFPRLLNIALQACIVSGAFTLKKDKKLFNLMHSWIEFSTEFNNRLNITENAMLLNQTPPNSSRWRIKLKEGQTFIIIKKSLTDLSRHLIKCYKNESGIDETTVLFDD